jgi:hypothetical protein
VVGLVNRVLDQVVPSRAVCILCGLAFAAVAFGEDLGPWEILHQGLLGTALGAAWAWDRGAWFPWGAHTAFRWLFSSVFRGGVYEVRSLEGPWGDGKHSPEHSLAILGPMAVFALVALAAAHRSKGLSPANESP